MKKEKENLPTPTTTAVDEEGTSIVGELGSHPCGHSNPFLRGGDVPRRTTEEDVVNLRPKVSDLLEEKMTGEPTGGDFRILGLPEDGKFSSDIGKCSPDRGKSSGTVTMVRLAR